SFAGPLADACKHRDTAVLGRDVVDQFLNDDGLSDARAAEQSDLSAFQVRLDEIDDFDSGLEHFEVRVLIDESRRRFVDRILALIFDWAQFIDGLTDHINDASESLFADWNRNRATGILRRHTTNHSVRRLKRDRANAPLAKVLLHFND